MNTHPPLAEKGQAVGGGGGKRAKSEKSWSGGPDAPSFLALPFASVLNLGPIPPLALRRSPQRVLYLPLHCRRMQHPDVLRGLSKDVLERGRLKDLVRPEDYLGMQDPAGQLSYCLQTLGDVRQQVYL